MEETKNLELGSGQEQEEKSAIDFQLIYSTLILNCSLTVAFWSIMF